MWGQYRDINELSHSRLLLRIREDIHTRTHTHIQYKTIFFKLLLKMRFDQVETGCNSEIIVITASENCAGKATFNATNACRRIRLPETL